MKLRDKSLDEIADELLWWSDFEENPRDADQLHAAIEDDPAALDKISFLNQQETGTLLDRSSFTKLDFYEVDFTELARLAIAEGTHLANDEQEESGLDYLKDYSNLKLVIQDMGDMFALYLKDYEFGYMKPLGMGICEYSPTAELLELDESKRPDFIRDCVLLSIENDLWEDDFNLKNELYDYYHDIPDTKSPLVQQKIKHATLLSVKEAASKLGVSDARVKKMVADKLIDGFKLGGKLLVSESSVNKRIKHIAKHGKPTRGANKPSQLEIRKQDRQNNEQCRPTHPAKREASAHARPTIELLPGETNWNYIERQFTYLFHNKPISTVELKRLTEDGFEDYRLTNFGFSRPLFVEISRKCFDANQYRRYYKEPICGKYHLCKEWYFHPEHPSFNLDKLQKWLKRMA